MHTANLKDSHDDDEKKANQLREIHGSLTFIRSRRQRVQFFRYYTFYTSFNYRLDDDEDGEGKIKKDLVLKNVIQLFNKGRTRSTEFSAMSQLSALPPPPVAPRVACINVGRLDKWSLCVK